LCHLKPDPIRFPTGVIVEKWILYALLAMVFAGVTSAIAKLGLEGISAELGMTVRTCFVFVFVMLFGVATVHVAEFQSLTARNYLWLALSAATTAISWVFYYKAIKEGEVSTVALIDKGSFVIAVLMAWLILGEHITWRIVFGCSLIIAGLFVVSRR